MKRIGKVLFYDHIANMVKTDKKLCDINCPFLLDNNECNLFGKDLKHYYKSDEPYWRRCKDCLKFFI